MGVYPQLETGALSQFPVRKTRRMRTVINTAADGSEIKLADPPAEITEWELNYAELTDGEMAALEEFFEENEGTLKEFTFLDPVGNLLAWSGKLDDEVWAREPLLTVTGEVADPNGGAEAWRVTNGGATAQGIWQTLEAPGAYTYCLSLFAKSNAGQEARATLLLGNTRAERKITSEWSRITVTGSGNPGTESVRFGVELPAGAAVEIFGIQAEPQAGASAYKIGTRGGVYENARFGRDELPVITTGPGRHSCTVQIIHVNHL